MKRIILVLLLITIYIAAEAQKLQFGLSASPGFAWIKPDSENLESDGSKIAFSYGIIADHNFADNYAFSTGIEVAYKGGKIDELVNTNDTTGTIPSQIVRRTKYTLQYIQLPISIKMKTKEIGYITYFGRFGFVPEYLIKAKAEEEVSNLITEKDATSAINDWNVSMLIALGGQYSLSGETALVASIHFENGFLDSLDGSKKAVINAISLKLGVLF